MAEKKREKKMEEKEGKKVEKEELKESAAKSTPSNTMAAVAYLLGLITGVIVYLVCDKNDKYVRFHAMQAILVGIVLCIVGFIAVCIDVLSFVILGAITGPLVCLCAIVFWGGTAVIILAPTVFLMYQAYIGNKFKVPVLGDFAEKYI